MKKAVIYGIICHIYKSKCSSRDQNSNSQNTLHVNGSLQVVKDINVGGDAQTKGNSGNKGEFLMSNGTEMLRYGKALSLKIS
jgi:hypothetical protein